MTRPRQILYRRLDVHRPSDAPAPSRGRVNVCAHTGFAQLLRPPRRSLPALARSSPPPDAEDLLTEDPLTQEDDTDQDRAQPPEVDEEPTTDAAQDWAQSLVPTCDTLDVLLVDLTGVHRLGEVPQPGRFDSVARTIAGFCNERTVGDSEGWSVRIALRADVLEQTTLELSISSCWLQLRFQTVDPESRRLILNHQDELRDQLARKLLRRRDIVITLD